eukprot:TRINITY_DN8151_c0_g2_i1.p1 TRINITY_DN8151_c0_g2~~TRINITY_DN8151_c0_g2_i1.p1  ORF type:complete len:284 (+),score=63.70 TRINITY_DN8151_c0_g2_i1:189-1040(+)
MTTPIVSSMLRVLAALPLVWAVEEPRVEELYRRGNQFVKVVHDVLSPEQCDEVIRLAEASYTSESKVYNRGEQRAERDNQFRIANTTFLPHGYWRYPAEQNFAEAIQPFVEVPLRNFEPLQVTRYGPGGFYTRHSDGFGREWTALLYLNEVEESAGGETEFFLVLHKDKKVAVRPKRGSAVIFSAQLQHQSKPLTKGIKWVANQWIHKERTQPFVEYYIVPAMTRAIPYQKELIEMHMWFCAQLPEGQVQLIYNIVSVMGVLLGVVIYRLPPKSKEKTGKKAA